MHAPVENTLVMHAPKNKHTARTFPTPHTDGRVQVMHDPENTHTHTHPHINFPTPHLNRGVELRTDYPINKTVIEKREQGRGKVDMNNVYGLEQKNRTETNVLHTLMTDCTTSETTLEKREQGGGHGG